MRSGPGNVWIERRADGWWVLDNTGYDLVKTGPYRWRWTAAFARWRSEP